MSAIEKLSGPNYRVWSLRVKRLLQSRGLWDVVDRLPKVEAEQEVEQPLEPPRDAATSAPAPAPPADFVVRDAEASCLIMDLCAPGPLDLIVTVECARSQWARLRLFYGPRMGLGQKLRGDFRTFAAQAGGKGILQIVKELDELKWGSGEVQRGGGPNEEEMMEVMKEVALRKGFSFGETFPSLGKRYGYDYETLLERLVSEEFWAEREKVPALTMAGSEGRGTEAAARWVVGDKELPLVRMR